MIIWALAGGQAEGAWRPGRKDFRELKVWQKAHPLTLAVYAATRRFPREELYGLTSQLRRSSSSIAPNLAEGCGRGSDADFAHFCWRAMGSASELESLLLLARDLGLLDSQPSPDLDAATTEGKRMLAGLLQKLTADGSNTGPRPRSALS